MGIKPPPSSRTYRTVGKNLDEDHFDAEHYISKFCVRQDDFDVIWFATLLYRMYNPRYRKRSVFPSACDVIDMHLGYEGVDEEPAWGSSEDKQKAITGLFAVQRLALFLEDQYENNRDECIVAEEKVYCPVCDTLSVHVTLGYKFEYMYGVLSRTDEITMINASLKCGCKTLGVSDVIAIREAAIEAVFEDFNT